jgi:hypothetical protein
VEGFDALFGVAFGEFFTAALAAGLAADLDFAATLA